MKIATTVMMTAMLSSMCLTATASERYGQQKVVYHINYNGDEGDKAYMAALGNIRNHINAVGRENIEVKVVLHGDGLNLLKNAKANSKLQMSVLEMKTNKLSFSVCNNTLEQRKISFENDLFEVEKEDIVPSGVAELSHLQKQGFTYIKP